AYAANWAGRMGVMTPPAIQGRHAVPATNHRLGSSARTPQPIRSITWTKPSDQSGAAALASKILARSQKIARTSGVDRKSNVRAVSSTRAAGARTTILWRICKSGSGINRSSRGAIEDSCSIIRAPGQGGRPRHAGYAFDFLFAAHRAFINADNFFRMDALIGLRPVVFLETAVPFLGPGLPFCFAHQAFFAAPILARAAGLIRRRLLTLAGLAWLLLGGRPRRAGLKPSPVRAAIACSIRLASCLSCATML